MARPKQNSTRVASRRLRGKSRRTNRRTRARRSNPASGMVRTKVHRRSVLFPATAEASWLTKLSWFASIAMKFISLIVGVEETPRGLRATVANVASGCVIALGPGDFASHSSFASFYTHKDTDKDVFSLRALPFERYSLSGLNIRVAPTVDLGKRGGLYAVLLHTVDLEDARAMINSGSPKVWLKRYPTDYEDIIKHPRAKIAPVTSHISISLGGSTALQDIRVVSTSVAGYVNNNYTHVLCIAFSDLAAVQASLDDNYSPTHGLFEVNMTGTLVMSDPAEITLSADGSAPGGSASLCSAKILTGETRRLTKFFHHRHEEVEGHEGMLYCMHPEMRNALCRHYGVTYRPPVDDFEMI